MLSTETSICLLDLFVMDSYFQTSYPYWMIVYLCAVMLIIKNDFSNCIILRYTNRRKLWRKQIISALLASSIISFGKILFIIIYSSICGMSKYNWDLIESAFFLNVHQTININWYFCLCIYILLGFLLCFLSMVVYIINRWIFNIPIMSWFFLLILFYFEYYSKCGIFFQNIYLKHEDWIDGVIWKKSLLVFLLTIFLLALGEWVSQKKEFYVE